MSASLTVPSQSVVPLPAHGWIFLALLRHEWRSHRALFFWSLFAILVLAGLRFMTLRQQDANYHALTLMIIAFRNAGEIVGLIHALAAAAVYGGSDVDHDIEEYYFSLPATRALWYGVKLLLGSGTVVALTGGVNLITALTELERFQQWSGSTFTFYVGTWGAHLSFILVLFAGAFVIHANSPKRHAANTAASWLWPLGMLASILATSNLWLNDPARVSGPLFPLLTVCPLLVLGLASYMRRECITGPTSRVPVLVPALAWTGAALVAWTIIDQTLR